MEPEVEGKVDVTWNQ